MNEYTGQLVRYNTVLTSDLIAELSWPYLGV